MPRKRKLVLDYRSAGRAREETQDEPVPFYAQDIHATAKAQPKRRRGLTVLQWTGVVVGATVLLAVLTKPDRTRTEAVPSQGESPVSTVTDIDRAAALALSATDWPNDMRIVNLVREGIREIHKVCPTFGVGAIGQGLALKYDTPWGQFVQKANRMGEPPEMVVAAALNLVHVSMLSDLRKRGCEPQDTAQPAALAQDEIEAMTEGLLLTTKTLEDWAYAPKRLRLYAAKGMVDADLNSPIERYPDEAIESYAQAVASCVDGVTNETPADRTTIEVGAVVFDCHQSLKKRWDFGPVLGPGYSIADRQ